MSYEHARGASSDRRREETFEDLVKLHRGELTRYAARQLGEHASLAEDVVQEALLSAHRAILAGTCPEHPRAWLFTIVRNAAVNTVRATRSTNEIEECTHGGYEQTVPAAVEQGEWIDWLMGAVGGLPARQRDALVGHAFEGRSHSEIAARQQTTVSAVKSLIGRARRKLAAESSFSTVLAGAPFAIARGLRRLLARGPLAGKAGATKSLVGVLAQTALAATVTTGVLMAVHGGSLDNVLASTGPSRLPSTGERLAGARAPASRHHPEDERTREQRIHRESRHAVRECLHGSLRKHYRRAALQYAANHLSTSALEYTECQHELRSVALHAGSSARHYASGSPRHSHRRAERTESQQASSPSSD